MFWCGYYVWKKNYVTQNKWSFLLEIALEFPNGAYAIDKILLIFWLIDLLKNYHNDYFCAKFPGKMYN